LFQLGGRQSHQAQNWHAGWQSRAEGASSSILNLAEGRRFTIVADRLSATNRYVAGVTLNGVALTRSYIRGNELRAGGELRFTMGPTPNKN
jgi:putative alpha-1,2-mannosidase